MKITKYNTRRPANWSPLFDDFFTRDLFFNPGTTTHASHRFATNIRETENAFELELAAPGFSKEQFDIALNDSTLIISASRETENTEQKETYYRKEFGATTLKRSFKVPDTVNAEAVSARFENGVLNVTLPKLQETVAPKRHIEVG